MNPQCQVFCCGNMDYIKYKNIQICSHCLQIFTDRHELRTTLATHGITNTVITWQALITSHWCQVLYCFNTRYTPTSPTPKTYSASYNSHFIFEICIGEARINKCFVCFIDVVNIVNETITWHQNVIIMFLWKITQLILFYLVLLP